MKLYELTYIYSPEISPESAETDAKSIESFIKEKEGIILSSTKLIPKTLSYPIKKNSSGFFTTLEFQVEPEKINELKEKLDNNEQVIRHMIVAKSPAKLQKERRTRFLSKEPIFAKKESTSAEIGAEKTKQKVELKDIEKELEDILGQ